MRPSSGLVLPVTISMNVVLPAPFGPITARSSALAIWKDKLLIALNPSNETETPDTSSSVFISRPPVRAVRPGQGQDLPHDDPGCSGRQKDRRARQCLSARRA